MRELLENAREELKRIDHLVYVTLKYTRTVDVFISVIERMINAYEYIVDALLKNAIEEGDVIEQPDNPLAKADLALKLYEGKRIKENIKKYLLLRKLRRTEYKKSNEFRRHVTMSTVIDNQLIEVNIDSITEDFHALKDFLDYINKKLTEK